MAATYKDFDSFNQAVSSHPDNAGISAGEVFSAWKQYQNKVSPPPQETNLADYGVALASGVTSTVGGVYDLADAMTGGMLDRASNRSVSSAFTKADEYWSSLYSEEAQIQNQQLSEAVDFEDKLYALLENPETIARGVVQSIPFLAATIVTAGGSAAFVAKGATKKALERGASKEAAKRYAGIVANNAAKKTALATNSSLVGGMSYGDGRDSVLALTDEELKATPDYKSLIDSGLTHNQVRDELAGIVGSTQGLTAAVISLAATKAFEADAFMAKVATGKTNGALNGLKSGLVAEGGQEAAESGGETYAGNLASRLHVNPEAELMAGVAGDALVGAVTGAPMGGAAGAISGFASRDKPEPTLQQKIDTLKAEQAAAASNSDAQANEAAQAAADQGGDALDQQTAYSESKLETEPFVAKVNKVATQSAGTLIQGNQDINAVAGDKLDAAINQANPTAEAQQPVEEVINQETGEVLTGEAIYDANRAAYVNKNINELAAEELDPNSVTNINKSKFDAIQAKRKQEKEQAIAPISYSQEVMKLAEDIDNEFDGVGEAAFEDIYNNKMSEQEAIRHLNTKYDEAFKASGAKDVELRGGSTAHNNDEGQQEAQKQQLGESLVSQRGEFTQAEIDAESQADRQARMTQSIQEAKTRKQDAKAMRTNALAIGNSSVDDTNVADIERPAFTPTYKLIDGTEVIEHPDTSVKGIPRWLDKDGNERKESLYERIGDNGRDSSPVAFTPTHEMPNGELVATTDEEGIYVDSEGNEWDEPNATAIYGGSQRGISGNASELLEQPSRATPIETVQADNDQVPRATPLKAEQLFSPHDKVFIKSVATGEDVEVNFRGYEGKDKAVIIMDGIQMAVNRADLKAKPTVKDNAGNESDTVDAIDKQYSQSSHAEWMAVESGRKPMSPNQKIVYDTVRRGLNSGGYKSNRDLEALVREDLSDTVGAADIDVDVYGARRFAEKEDSNKRLMDDARGLSVGQSFSGLEYQGKRLASAVISKVSDKGVVTLETTRRGSKGKQELVLGSSSLQDLIKNAALQQAQNVPSPKTEDAAGEADTESQVGTNEQGEKPKSTTTKLDTAKQFIGVEVGEKVVFSGDVGYASKGREYTVKAIRKDGSIDVESDAGATVLSYAEIKRATNSGVTASKSEKEETDAKDSNEVPFEKSVDDNVKTGKPLSEIMITEQVELPNGATAEIEQSADVLLNDIDSRLAALNELRGCLL